MLTQVDVECDNPFYMSVLGANPRDSLILQSISGLGPPDKSLFVGDYARDGGLYSGRRVLTRNPVLNIQINPNFGNGETVEGWRDILYRAFNDPYAPNADTMDLLDTDGDEVTLIFHDDIAPDRRLSGYCEKFDAETFAADSVVQVSMISTDPFIRDVTVTDLIPPSGTAGWTTVPFTYAGNAEVGFETWIKVSSPSMYLTLYNNGQIMFLTYPTFQPNDIVYINTKPGQRKIQLTPAAGGGPLDILYTLSSASTWLKLHSQSNSLKVYGATSSSVVAAITELKYTNTYWGL